MSPDQALAFALFAIVAATTPGPSNVILASTGATVGVVRGLPCLFGVVGGMGFMVFVVAFGLGSLVLENPALLNALQWSGIAVLLWLSWKIATSGGGESAVPGPILGFWKAAAFQWVNPKSWLITASAIGVYMQVDAGSTFGQSAFLGTLFFLAALPGCFLWLAFGAMMQRFLRTERAKRRFNLAMGLLLAGSVVLFVR